MGDWLIFGQIVAVAESKEDEVMTGLKDIAGVAVGRC